MYVGSALRFKMQNMHQSLRSWRHLYRKTSRNQGKNTKKLISALNITKRQKKTEMLLFWQNSEQRKLLLLLFFYKNDIRLFIYFGICIH